MKMMERYTRGIRNSAASLVPVLAVISFFQLVIVRKPLPAELSLLTLSSGALLLVVGLTLLVRGLETGLFVVGESQARSFVQKGSIFWLLAFGFALGFGATYAEPALNAITGRAAIAMAEGGHIDSSSDAIRQQHFLLRLSASVAVAFALALGILRILRNWPLHHLVLGLYGLAIVLALFNPLHGIGLAFDSGGFTSSAITVPLVAALGIGLASTIHGRHPLADGFGMVAIASVMPVIFLLLFGALQVWLT